MGVIVYPPALLRPPSVYSPVDYGAIPGGDTGDAARNLVIADLNRAAFQACADAFVLAVKGGDRSATFIFPNKQFLISSAAYVGANYLSGGYGWTRHSVVFDCGVWTDDEVEGGVIVGDGGWLTRVENDSGSAGTASDSNNSTILVIGKWRSLAHKGLVRLEGFQVDTLDEGDRGITSGDGWQFCFGVQGFTAEHLWGWKGTNAAFCINLNKRGEDSTSESPTTGFDMRDGQICKWFEIGQVTAINGEHGGLINSAYDIKINSMSVRQREYTFGGEAQSSYQQRGLYLLNAYRTHVGMLDVLGVNHVACFGAVYDESRTAYDLDFRVDSLVAEFPTSQDGDPDRYAVVELQNSNNGVGTLRTISASFGLIKAKNHKSTVVWRESHRSGYVDETAQVLKSFRLDNVAGRSVLHGIYLFPDGGAGEVILNGGTVRVLKDTSVSSTTEPADGVTVMAATVYNKAVAEASPVTLSTLNGYTYSDGVTFPTNYIKPGNVKNVSDWPGGAATVIYDPNGTGYWTSPDGWREIDTPGRIEVLHCALALAHSSNKPGRFGGADLFSLNGTMFQYTDESVSGADGRCLYVHQMSEYGTIDYKTSDGLRASQTYQSTPLTTPLWRHYPRQFTRDFASVAANAAGGYADYAVSGAKVGDQVIVTCMGDQLGMLFYGYCNTNDNVRVKPVNGSGSAIDLGSLDFQIWTKASVA